MEKLLFRSIFPGVTMSFVFSSIYIFISTWLQHMVVTSLAGSWYIYTTHLSTFLYPLALFSAPSTLNTTFSHFSRLSDLVSPSQIIGLNGCPAFIAKSNRNLNKKMKSPAFSVKVFRKWCSSLSCPFFPQNNPTLCISPETERGSLPKTPGSALQSPRGLSHAIAKFRQGTVRTEQGVLEC